MGVAAFADRLRRLRERAELTQEQLAAKTGLSYQTIQSYETRNNPTKPKRPNAIKIARALRWDIDEALGLLGYEPLDEDERAQPRDEQWDRLDDLWPYLTEQQRFHLVNLIECMVVKPAQPPKGVVNRGIRLRPGSGEVPGQRGDNNDGSGGH